jgi:hypothetical protein
VCMCWCGRERWLSTGPTHTQAWNMDEADEYKLLLAKRISSFLLQQR